MTEFTLTPDQLVAENKFVEFLMNPQETVLVIEGYSGTGKSTLIRTLMDKLNDYMDAAELLSPDFDRKVVALTATTHKAADNFSKITGMDVNTIHSYLGLRVVKDPLTGRSELRTSNTPHKYNELIFIDEASMVDSILLDLIFKLTHGCKIVFIGDPAQLPPVKSSGMPPVFASKFNTAMLTKVMRQTVNGVPQSNPITDLATAFRETVNTGVWPSGIEPDGEYILRVSGAELQDMINTEFTRPDWKYHDSKILAWTNEKVIQYNQYIREIVSGDPKIQVGDYVENNSFVTIGRDNIKTDQTVYVSDIAPDSEEYGVVGNWMILDNKYRAFHPHSRSAKLAVKAIAKKEYDYDKAKRIDSWVDLRAVFAQTINKSQGSTYDRVFIDLGDVRKCTNGNLMARMLYVAVSRARKQVIFVGDVT